MTTVCAPCPSYRRLKFALCPDRFAAHLFEIITRIAFCPNSCHALPDAYVIEVAAIGKVARPRETPRAGAISREYAMTIECRAAKRTSSW